MSAMSELAAETTSYGGRWEMHGHWLAHDADGKPADGFRWARLVTDDGEPYWHYAGRSFVLADAAEVLATIVVPS